MQPVVIAEGLAYISLFLQRLSMRLYVAVTDKDWFALHASKPEVDEVNFWRPSSDATFKARRFQKLSALPDVVSDPKVNVAWWEALEHVYEREKVVWRLFVGSQPSPEQNKLYAQFRAMLLKGSRIKASA
jgi:hypothetical protein